MVQPIVQDLQKAVVEALFRRLGEKEYRRVMTVSKDSNMFNISEPTLREIVNFSPRQVSMLAKMASGFIRIELDEEYFEASVYSVVQDESRDADVDEFLRLGASLPLLEECFGIKKPELASLKRGLGLDISLGGKPKELSDEDKERVFDLWDEYHHIDEINRYLAIARLTSISLKNIHAALRVELSMRAQAISRVKKRTAAIA